MQAAVESAKAEAAEEKARLQAEAEAARLAVEEGEEAEARRWRAAAKVRESDV